jgi:GTP-binding protein
MKVNDCIFETGAARARGLPAPDLPEIAFLGRSNVGKSSLINTLTTRRALARVSSTPGKTRQINFFRIDGRLRFVDLPGIGYARVPRAERESWQRLIAAYVGSGRPIALLVLLLDARHHLQDNDAVLLEWLLAHGLPVQLVLTKTDKLTQSERSRQLRYFTETAAALGYAGTPLPFSSVTGAGKQELWGRILEAASAS